MVIILLDKIEYQRMRKLFAQENIAIQQWVRGKFKVPVIYLDFYLINSINTYRPITGHLLSKVNSIILRDAYYLSK